MKKILVSAYGCEPGKGSESGVGWHWVIALAKKYEVWVITRSNNQMVIEASSEDLSNIHFIYYDRRKIAKLIKNGDKGLYPYYFLWQVGIIPLAKQLNDKEHFDLCMHVSFGSMWMPTFLYRLKIPFVWGPIGGAESIPNAYWINFSKKERFMQVLRKYLISFAKYLPLFALPAKYAFKIIVRTDDSRIAFSKEDQSKIITSLETCVEDAVFEMYENGKYKGQREQREKLSMIYTGRLMSIKAVDIALKALAQTKNYEHLYLKIVGKGPMESYLKQLVKDLRIEEHVEFVGQVQRSEALNLVAKSDVFVFPSLKEGGTWALMEALALGKPCICHDSSGMHLIADETCACMIREDGIQSSINQFANAIDYLYENQEIREKMGKNANERMKKLYRWREKEKWIAEVI